ncbi:MAG: AI-2E family transporter [archaeon]|nr:AI-2E family transporter [archaeon]
MEEEELIWDSSDFRARIATLSHALVIMTIVTIWLIYLQDVFQPLFVALGIYFVLKPGSEYLSKSGFPIFLSYLTMLLLAFLLVSAAGFFAYDQAQSVLNDDEKMNEYSEKMNDKWSALKSYPFVRDIITNDESPSNTTLSEDLEHLGILDASSASTDLFLDTISNAGTFLINGLTVSFFLIFVIFEASLLPGRIERAWPGGVSEQVKIVRDQIESSINTYVIVKTGVGLGTAFIAGVIMLLFGIDLWFTWALLTFLFNYVPYIGSLIATIPPIILGFILLDPSMVVLLTILLLVNQQVWGNIIETKWAGRALDISPVLLLVVTAFSFWLWGIIGMILSIPLVVILKIVLENIEETRPLAILLSERAPTLEEAWKDAIKDGRISDYEQKMLLELKEKLGVSDEYVQLMSARIAAQHAQRRGRISEDQITLIASCQEIYNGKEWFESFVRDLAPGKISLETKDKLSKFVNQAIDDEEE